MTALPKVARIAAFCAFLIATVCIISGLTGFLLAIPFAVIPLLAGIGILRRRVWSAYGYALCIIAGLVFMPVLVLRASNRGAMAWEYVGAALFAVVLATLFVFAGRALSNSGAQRGSPVPWIVVALVTTAPLFFLEAFVVPTGAMENTILVGDRILVSVFPRAHPVLGDIVSFSYPVDRKQTYIKRIIGVPGDHIRISHKVVYRNGEPLSEPWAIHATTYEDSYRDDFPNEPNVPLTPQAQEMLAKNVTNGEVVVPPGRYFVMGDNRDSSYDSRYWGFITEADVIGKPVVIYDSVEQTNAELSKPQNPFQPRRTRWNRLFKWL